MRCQGKTLCGDRAFQKQTPEDNKKSSHKEIFFEKGHRWF